MYHIYNNFGERQIQSAVAYKICCSAPYYPQQGVHKVLGRCVLSTQVYVHLSLAMPNPMHSLVTWNMGAMRHHTRSLTCTADLPVRAVTPSCRHAFHEANINATPEDTDKAGSYCCRCPVMIKDRFLEWLVAGSRPGSGRDTRFFKWSRSPSLARARPDDHYGTAPLTTQHNLGCYWCSLFRCHRRQ